ncbi:DUF2809 domain-containing protein [Aquimarina addita]|uniref:DUF2809 domain-containing protein n=1 Tax=Aquimarina addita TaxID=870485 RepID=A0ABP6UNY0_9FLAO
MKRNRNVSIVAILLTILTGFLSRTSLIPELLYPYAGDYLYALMWFFIVGFIDIEIKSFRVMLISIMICYIIEFFQLYQAHWITTIRNYKLGALILGQGFLWSDIISYTFGGITGFIIETFCIRGKQFDEIV